MADLTMKIKSELGDLSPYLIIKFKACTFQLSVLCHEFKAKVAEKSMRRYQDSRSASTKQFRPIFGIQEISATLHCNGLALNWIWVYSIWSQIVRMAIGLSKAFGLSAQIYSSSWNSP